MIFLKESRFSNVRFTLIFLLLFNSFISFGQTLITGDYYEYGYYKYLYSNIDRTASFCDVIKQNHQYGDIVPDMVIYPFGGNSAWYVTGINIPKISCEGLSIFMPLDYTNKNLVIAKFGADEKLDYVSLENPFSERWDKPYNSQVNHSTIVISDNVFDDKCPNLRNLYMDGVESAGSKAFYGMKQGKIVCYGSGVVYNGSVPQIEEDTFCAEAYENVDVYVNGLQFYIDKPGWKNFKKIHDISELITLLKFDKSTYNIYVNNSFEPTLDAKNANSEDANRELLKWSSSNENICTVSDGVITGHSEGEATITVEATCGEKASCTVKILKPAIGLKVTSPDLCLIGSELVIGVGESGNLVAEIWPEDTTDKSLRWNRSSYYEIDDNGKITGLKVGGYDKYYSIVQTPIKIDSGYILQEELLTTVVEPVDKLILNYSDVSLNVNDTLKLELSSFPYIEHTIDNCIWTFSDKNVAFWASKNNHSEIVAKSPGVCVVTAHTAKGITASCTITVDKVPVSRILIDKDSLGVKDNNLALYVGDVKKINVVVEPENASYKAISFESSSPEVATIDENGNLEAHSLGETTITIFAQDNPEIMEEIHINVVETPAASILFREASVFLKESETIDLIATISPETTTDKSLTWKSSNENIAVVDENGRVTAIAIGQAIITATAVNGVCASCEVRVKETLAKSVSLNIHNVVLKAGETVDLIATVLPETTTNKSVTWRSFDNDVATVDENGKVTAISNGTTSIYVEAVSGDPDESFVMDRCTVTVVKTPANSISLNMNEATMKATETLELAVSFLPENTTDKYITWKSSDESVATVDENGKVTAIAIGKAIIKATATSGVSDSCEITVVETHADSISLNLNGTTLKSNESVDLIATISPETTTDKSLTWESSDENVATVDENGKVTAISIGEAVITTTASSGVSASCKVTVVETLANSISLNETEIIMNMTEIFNLDSTVLPETTTNKSVTWESSDENIATVDENGIVTAIAAGSVIITAITNDGSNLSASCSIEVCQYPIPVSSITIKPLSLLGKVGDCHKLIVTILPDDATNQDLQWTSDNNEVAEVNNDGIVTLKSTGNAIIEASSTDGSLVSATCAIIVFDESGISDIDIDDNNYVRIYDIQGLLIFEGQLEDANLSSGTYIILSKGKKIKRRIR